MFAPMRYISKCGDLVQWASKPEIFFLLLLQTNFEEKYNR